MYKKFRIAVFTKRCILSRIITKNQLKRSYSTTFITSNDENYIHHLENKCGKPKEKIRVVVGMSGGVDSAVSAFLLKKQGFDVVGLYMNNWDEADEEGRSVCPQKQDWLDVQRVCNQLSIPCYKVEFIKEYWTHVFEKMIKDYQRGITPNPDILCNKHIKFDAFYKYAITKLEGDYMATGHYVRVRDITKNGKLQTTQLLRGIDPKKDQSYFLANVNWKALSNTIFPIGHLLKTQVRQIAKENNLVVAEKKESMGICFIGKRKFSKFLSEYLEPKKGKCISINGEVVGEHQGVSFYTIGQNAHLEKPEKWFVFDKDVENNILYVCPGTNHEALYTCRFFVDELNWISGEIPDSLNGNSVKLTTKIRHKQNVIGCEVKKEGDRLVVQLDEKERGVAPGQICVLYDNEICLGGGIISKK